jgi:PAS domain S-box-containing protein
MASLNRQDLSEALERDEIVPYFQPLVELRTGKLTGFEVLARWKHPIQGLIPPDKFISLAEHAGLIGKVTDNILRRAFASASVIPSSLSLSVNISPLQFRDRELPVRIEAALNRGGFAGHRLILEVTESALVDNMRQARTSSEWLKRLGIRLALDDFGTGYSSLRHLQSLPFDELKVDASFVRSMDHTRESRKIAAAVVGLGHSLGLTTLAEGIETQAQAEMLLWLGCEFGQGWLYGQPVPADELQAIISRTSLAPAMESVSDVGHGSLPANLEALPMQRLAQLQAIYDGAPVGLCFLDTQMRYININRRLAEMNGTPIADHIGRRVSDLHPDLYQIAAPYIRRALQGESQSGMEVTSPKSTPDGGHRTLLLSYQPARDEADEVIGVSVAVVDISARKAAEEALKQSEEHYRNAVELNPHIPWTASADFIEIDVSPSWLKLTGVPTENISHHGWLDVVHPEDLERAKNAVSACLRTGDLLDLELRVRRTDGEWIWLRSRGSARRDGAGNIIRWYGSMEDIDDRKKTEEALQASEALLKAVFKAVPVGIVAAEAPSGQILMSNPQAEKIFQRPIISADKISDYRKTGAIHPDGRPYQPDDYPLTQAILTGEIAGPAELLYLREDGSDTWISATAAPFRGQDGNVAGGVVALLDVDAVKREKYTLLERIGELERQLEETRQHSKPIC